MRPRGQENETRTDRLIQIGGGPRRCLKCAQNLVGRLRSLHLHAASFMSPRAGKAGSLSSESLSRMLLERRYWIATSAWLLGVLCFMATYYHLQVPATAPTRLFRISPSLSQGAPETDGVNATQVEHMALLHNIPTVMPTHWPSEKPFNPDTQVRACFHCIFNLSLPEGANKSCGVHAHTDSTGLS